MKKLFVPLTKSPWSSGRVGKIEYQDWYRVLVRTKKLIDSNPESRVALISNVFGDRSVLEVDIYNKYLLNLGLSENNIVSYKECFETSEQIYKATDISRELGLDLVIISTLFHYPRVRWIGRNINADYIVCLGIPRPIEMVTDVLLTFAYPIVDMIGLKGIFVSIVKYKRSRFGY